MCAKRAIVFGSLLLLGLAAGVSQAGTITWGNYNYSYNAWNDARNWVGGVLPTTGDTAVLGTGAPSMNATLSPAPDVIRIDSGARAVAVGGTLSNNLVLNGGRIDMSSDNNPTMTGAIQLTADSTIQNTRGNSNRGFKVNGVISEDGTPRKLTLSGYPTTSGALLDSTSIGGTNTYSGGTTVSGASNYLKSLGALGTGPVSVTNGRLVFNMAGDYTHGKVTVTGGSVVVGANGIANEVWDFQGGTLTYDQAYRALDVTNRITIENTVNIAATGSYYNNPFAINASIGGTGKAILNSNGGTTSGDIVQFGATQGWTGGTEVKGIVEVTAGCVLPGGTLTVYPVTPASGTGLLRIDGASGLDPTTDLILQYDAVNNKYGTIMIGGNQIVHSLTINGSVISAGFYTATDLPNYIVGSGTYTIRVMTPDVGPNVITDLAGTSPDWFKVTLTWAAPADNIDPIASAYDVRYSTSQITDANFNDATPIAPPTPLSPGQQQTVTVSGLQGDTTYYFAVKSADGGMNWSEISNIAAVTTIPTDSVAPAAVSDLAVVDIKPNRVKLSWTATGDDGVTGTASAYDVRVSSGPITSEAAFAAAAPVTTGLPTPKAAGGTDSVTVSGLAASTTYYFAIKVGDEVPNWSAVSNQATATTSDPDPLPPLAVGSLAIRGIGIHDVTLAWTAPADQGSAGTNAYDLRYSTSAIQSDADFDAATVVTGLPVPAAPGNAEQFAVTGLAPSTTYYFAIKTADAAEPANISALSNVVSGTTLPPIVPVTVHNPWLVNDRVADTHNINTMGATYGNAYTPDGVVPPATNEQKAINIYNNQKRRLYHWADEPPSIGGNDINDPTYNQNVFGWCLCGRHAAQACTIVQATGMTPRLINYPGHWTYEVQYDGLWHQFDTMCTHYIYTRDVPPHIACSQDIKNDNSLEYNAVTENRACPGYLLCGDTAQDYVTFCKSWSASGSGVVATRWTGDMDLRIGQTFKRTWESWLNEHPTIRSGTPPYHHEASRDNRDYVNYPYWEPYRLTSAQSSAVNITYNPTFRRWANGTDVLAPDFRSAACQSLLDPTSHDIATYNSDGITPDLHASTVGTTGEAVFKVNVPFYITDASISGDFVRTNASDTCSVLFSSNGTTWTNVYTAGLGASHVTGQSLRSNVFGLYQMYWIKIQIKSTAALTNAGVSNFSLATIFEHNKGAMAYLDKGVNNLTLTFDNPAELAASGNVLHLTYKWKEYDGADWTIDKQFDTFVTTSPYAFTITTGGSKVPRTEYIAMEITQLETIPPSPINTLVAGATTKNSAQLNWTATGDDGIYGKASRYDIRYSTSPIADMNSFNVATAVTGVPMPQMAGSPETFTVTGLSAGTTYYFAVVAYDKGNNCSGLSNVITATTLVDTPPAAITDLAAPPAGRLRNSIQLTWTATGEDGSVGTAKSYDLRYSTDTIATMADFSAATQVVGEPTPKASGSAETFTVTGLTAATTYNFALVVYDAGNTPSGLSNVVAATTPADLPPAPVTDLIACSSCITRTSVQLNWTASGEDGNVGTASRYDLRYSTNPITDMASFNAATVVTGLSAPNAAGQGEVFTVNGLTAATTYRFALVVYDAANQPSGLSNIVTATTRQPRKLGDIDDDGQVNLADLKLLVVAWNSQGGGAYANWNPDADFDGDNNVNLSDLKILVAHWNQ